MFFQRLYISAIAVVISIGANAQTDDVRLTMPIHFDTKVVHDVFKLDSTEENVSEKMMDIYIRHPEFVNPRLNAYDGKSNVDVPLKQHTKLVDKVAPSAIEPTWTAPVKVLVQKPNFWNVEGDYSLHFTQNYVSGNWYKGGESYYSALGALNMEANYNNKQKVKWENMLELKFGLQSTSSDTIHRYKTTEDLIRLTSKLGLQASNKWYYTLKMQAQSQFTHGYKTNKPNLYSHFLAPLNLNVSVGMDYTIDWLDHRLKGNVHLAPFAYNMKYTRLIELSKHLGLEEGDHFLHDYGSKLDIDFKWQLMDQLQWKCRLYAYTTYKKIEAEWENTFTFQFNRWLSAQLFLFPRFDDGVTRDSEHGYFQFKEYTSLGFQYSF